MLVRYVGQGQVEPALGVILVGDLLENEALTPKSAEFGEDLLGDLSMSMQDLPLVYL
jgi:hypothetical protein